MKCEGGDLHRAQRATIDGAKMPEEDTPSAEMYFGANRSHESTCTCPAGRENEAVEKAVLQDARRPLDLLNFAPASRRAAPSFDHRSFD